MQCDMFQDEMELELAAKPPTKAMNWCAACPCACKLPCNPRKTGKAHQMY